MIARQRQTTHKMWLLTSSVILLLIALNTCGIQSATIALNDSDELNDRPIIGVLALDMSWYLDGKWPGEFKSYIAASYVKFVEGGGARVVPIWIDRPRAYYEDIMTKINGVLIPGGAVWFNETGGYVEAGRYIYEIAQSMNDAGAVMPIWGTCLGFELMAFVTSEKGDPRSDCSSDRQALHLDFESDIETSRLFGKAPADILEILSTEPVTSNFHRYCLTKDNLKRYGISEEWRVLSNNNDWDGFEFISSMEHHRYPFYGVQFHPEKNIYEWIENRNITHTSNAIRANQYFAQFFVNQARRNFNRFPGGVDEENRVLIYNFPTNFTALVKSAYTQCYLFPENIDYITSRRPSTTEDNRLGVALSDF